MKVEELLDILARFAWTCLIAACAGFAGVSLVRYIMNPSVVPERIEVVIVGDERPAPPQPDTAIGQKLGSAIVGSAADGK